MKKHLSTMIFLTALMLNCTNPCSATESPPAFTVNGESIHFDEFSGIPYISDSGRTMMPVRACLNAIDGQVEWDQDRLTVLIRKDTVLMEIPIGEQELRINGTAFFSDSAAIIIEGRTYLPLRTVLNTFGYAVEWQDDTRTVAATELTPFNVNGGTTGIFSRRQLDFIGFDGAQATVTLPRVTLAEKGDCPYVYFGFDWENDEGNIEAGFQFIEDPNHPLYNCWTVFMRQGEDWLWPEDHISLLPGSTHHIKFYAEPTLDQQMEMVIELDGQEVIRKISAITDFSHTSVKAVVSMAMLKIFDGSNCLSRSEQAHISQLMVSAWDSETYGDFNDYELYSRWQPDTGINGMWYGTVDCIPSYLHYEKDGFISIYKGSSD